MASTPPPAEPGRADRTGTGDAPLLPERSPEETDAGWGERPEPDDDERLRRDRPPHWDSA